MQKAWIIFTIFIFTIFIIPNTHATSKWRELNKLVDSEIKAISSIRHRKSKLEYRLFELYSEKVKLIREKENNIFLKASPTIVRQKGKKTFFRKTRTAYYKTKKLGISIIRKWPRTRHKPDIYYTLALNSRDYGRDGNAEKYFRLTIKYAVKNSKIAHSAKVSLAEFYYNAKKWNKAHRIYKDILKSPRDEFHSKHLYNSAWCLYQMRKLTSAIHNMHRAFAFSKNKNYININDQIFDFMGLFHVDGKDIPAGVKFYIKNTEDPGPYLIKMSKRTAKNGQFSDTKYILKHALIESRKRKQYDTETNIRLEELIVYRKFKKGDLHHQIAKVLASMHNKTPLRKELHDTAIKDIKEYAGYLTIRLTKNAKRNVRNYSKQLLDILISYFDILVKLDKTKTDQYRFYQGETFYAVRRFISATQYYQLGLKWSNQSDNKTKENKDSNKFRRKLLNSMLASLAEGKFKKTDKFNYTEFAYTNHISYWPVDPKSRKIYERLFNLYFKKKMFQKAVNTVSLYNQHYHGDIEKHRAMINAIIDHNIKSKNTKRLAYWVNKIIKGLYTFDNIYIDKATIVLGKLLFEKIQKVENKNLSHALKMYEMVYDNKIYPQKIKAEAALWISIIHLDQGKTHESFEWASKSIEYFPKKELFDNKTRFVTIAKKYYLRQDFHRSMDISKQYLNIFCNTTFKEKQDFIQNLIQLSIAIKNPQLAASNLKEYTKCYQNRKFEIKSKTSILNYYIFHNEIDNFFNFYSAHKTDLALTEIFFSAMLRYYWHSVYLDRPNLKERIVTIFKAVLNVSSTEPAPSGKVVSSIRAIFRYNDFITNSKSFFDFKIEEKKEFEEKLFNNQLQQKVILLKQLEDAAIEIIKLGQSDVMLGVYKILNHAGREFSQILLDYNPKGMPKEFVTSFKRSMKQLITNLQRKVSNNTRNIDRIIHKNLLLSYLNTEVTQDSELRKETGFYWPYEWRSTIVDFKENSK